MRWVAAADIVERSVAAVGELEAAFRRGARYQEDAATLAEFLAEPSVRVGEVTPGVSRRYGERLASLRRSHPDRRPSL